MAYKKQGIFKEEVDEIALAFTNAIESQTLKKIQDVVTEVSFLERKYKLAQLFDDYLFYGGFPYVIENKDTDDTSKYLRDILGMTFSRDIMSQDQIQIREVFAFERLMVNLCMNIGNRFSLSSLAQRIGVKDERTVRKYIDYYVDSHYAFVTTPFSYTNKQINIKLSKKIYVNDTGLVNTLLFKNQKDLQEDKQYKSLLVENSIHNALYNYSSNTRRIVHNGIPYWVDPKTEREIDFIFEVDNFKLPIEVKYKTNVEECSVPDILDSNLRQI